MKFKKMKRRKKKNTLPHWKKKQKNKTTNKNPNQQNKTPKNQTKAHQCFYGRFFACFSGWFCGCCWVGLLELNQWNPKNSMNYLPETHTQEKRPKLLFLHEQGLANHRDSLGLVWIQAGNRHHLGLRPPRCLQGTGSTDFSKLVGGSVVLGSSRTFQKPQQSREDFSLAYKNQVKTNSGCRTFPPSHREPTKQSSREHWSSLCHVGTTEGLEVCCIVSPLGHKCFLGCKMLHKRHFQTF